MAFWGVAPAEVTTSSVYSINDGKVTLKTWDDTATGPVIQKVFSGVEIGGGVKLPRCRPHRCH